MRRTAKIIDSKKLINLLIQAKENFRFESTVSKEIDILIEKIENKSKIYQNELLHISDEMREPFIESFHCASSARGGKNLFMIRGSILFTYYKEIGVDWLSNCKNSIGD